MSSTRSLRFVNPPSAGKNGTWVVPACVMSGPSPETAALRMRSNWTSQPTSWTSTFTPVLAVNGATIFCRSSFGLGELGIVHSVRVVPRSSCSPCAALLVVVVLFFALSSSPPQATTATGASTSAIADATIASLLGTGVLPPREFVIGTKTVLELSEKKARPWLGVHLLGGRGGAADDELDGEGSQGGTLGIAGDPRDERVAGRGAEAELVLAQRGEGRGGVGSELDVVEADHAEVARDLQAGLDRGADRADGHQVRRGEDRRGRIVGGQQLRRRLAAGLRVEVAVAHVVVAVGEPQRLDRGA